MFDRNVDYPTAVASYDDNGVNAAMNWCIEHRQDGDTISVWTSLKSSLAKSAKLDRFVQRYRNVEHITGRGGGTPTGRGPVLMAWPDMDDIGKLVQHGYGITALCVITWVPDRVRPWVTVTNPQILGDGSDWQRRSPGIDPVVLEALKGLTVTVNHNNTIAAGYEKDHVVSALLALHDAGLPMDADTMQGWALAHGWSGENPTHLAKYVRDINTGKRPSASRVLRPDYVQILRDRITSGDAD
ncbi:hypothetical protein ACO229_14175 [Promicromonospora sp. MS192]|uniref:hypothetical protein n=1 Tax=Promicromonospora sp. MS192 TaxID=3412684 RepID=UPI003C2F64BE